MERLKCKLYELDINSDAYIHPSLVTNIVFVTYKDNLGLHDTLQLALYECKIRTSMVHLKKQ